MGMWEVFNSAKDTLKRNSPDLTPTADACRSFYNLGWSAITTVKDNGGPKLNEFVKDPESQKKIGSYLTHPSTLEALKFLSGSPTVSQKLNEFVKDPENQQKIGSYLTHPLTLEALKSLSGSYTVSQKLNEFVKDPESQKKIGSYLTHPLTLEALKFLPGGAQAVGFAEVLLRHHPGAGSVHNDKEIEYLVEQIKKEMKEMQAENKQLKAELEGIKGLYSANVPHGPGSLNSTVAEKPGDSQVDPIRGKFEPGPISESVQSN